MILKKYIAIEKMKMNTISRINATATKIINSANATNAINAINTTTAKKRGF